MRTSEGENVTQRKVELLGLMKDGKQALSLEKSEEAKEMFESALGKLEEAKAELDSPWRAERKVFRGLGAASAQLGDHAKALDYMMKVVSLSEAHQDFRGLGDAYGVIADIYTEVGDLEKAASYYDKYLAIISEL